MKYSLKLQILRKTNQLLLIIIEQDLIHQHQVMLVFRSDMLPTEWIYQPEWIKIANINFLNLWKKIPICNPDIFALHILGVKCKWYVFDILNKTMKVIDWLIGSRVCEWWSSTGWWRRRSRRRSETCTGSGTELQLMKIYDNNTGVKGPYNLIFFPVPFFFKCWFSSSKFVSPFPFPT